MKIKKILQSVFLTLLTLVLVFLVVARAELKEASLASYEAVPAMATEPTPSPSPTASPTPTPEPTPTPTPEPQPEYFTLSFIGDCTLTSHQMLSQESPYHYASRMNGDYSYPFSNTVEYFEKDDFTLANLECTFSDQQMYSAQTFYFRAPSEWAQILTHGGVDFVTTANNHMYDFGETGAQDTFMALEYWGIPYGTDGQAQLFTTESGLTLGIYCAYRDYMPSQEAAVQAIAQLREQGAEYVICAFHWGQELFYEPTKAQIDLAHACADAGADLIYGSHSHCLQPIEEYNGALILYSMGNWSFGGNTSPSDRDTAIVQITVKRDLDGSISRDSYDIIPCCVSSLPVGADNGADNDYRPTPYEEGSEEYLRTLSKLDGSYQAGSQGADYSGWYASYGGAPQ